MWGRNRYRMPIDSFVIILGCYGMIVAYDFIKTQFLLKGRIKEQSSQLSKEYQKRLPNCDDC